MKLPLSLIQTFLPPINLSPQDIGETLTLLGIELDRIENPQPSFAKVVIAEVLEVEKHPEAKNLQIAQVSDGTNTVQVVCGDPKCHKGMRTAFAPIGAILTDSDGKQRQIEKTQIRGVDSFGMLCSGAELHVTNESDQILDLPNDFKIGEDAAHALWDPTFELSLTPNLGHAMSALGIARELSCALNLKLDCPETIVQQKPIDLEIFVDDSNRAPRYMCAVIEKIKVGPSPFWLKKQLEACGQKSINNVVDVTNFIMMKLGQPLHAFDLDKLHSGKIEIGTTDSQFPFQCLDGVERTVPKGALLIKDGQTPIAIAGVMGGENSMVTEGTTRIALEAAYFDPISIRSTSRKMGLRTESSQRFEKGTDPNGVQQALLEAVELLGGKIVGYTDNSSDTFEPKEIRYRSEWINRILGTKLSQTEMVEIFERLGFSATKETVHVPLYRSDIHLEIDLAEEIARIYGYNNIEKKAPRCRVSEIPNDPVFVFENKIRSQLIGMGLNEFLSCDLIGPELAEISRTITPESMHFLKARYAKTEEYSILRTSLLPGLLEVAQGNISKKNQDLAAFEIGRIHFLQKEQPVEVPNVAILLSGKTTLPHWGTKQRNVDFFDLKGMIENLVDGAHFAPTTHLSFHPGRQADIHIGEEVVGSLGEVHPTLLNSFNINQRIYYAELNLSNLMHYQKSHLKVTPLPQYPASERDLTLPLPLKFPVNEIFNQISKQNSQILEKIDLIDLYIPETQDQKNATFRFTYRDLYKTISFEEVETEHAKIVESITKLLAK